MLRFLFVLLLFVFPLHVHAKDRLRGVDFTVSVVRDGAPLSVYKNDKRQLRSRIVKVFNSNTASTKDIWLYQKFGGKPLDSLWNDYKSSGSYFSLMRDKPKEKLGRSEIDPVEVIITINPYGQGQLMGTVLAKLRDGEVRGYEVDDSTLLNLYCFDKAARYLPEGYEILQERYSGEIYIESGIQCSTERKKQNKP